MDAITQFGQVAPSWLCASLRSPPLNYVSPLPIQCVVLPQVAAALVSGIHMDVCLTAPTGAGKTLCYLLPLIRHISAMKCQLNDRQIRGVILVPTNALGHQVASIVSALVAKQDIKIGLCCGDSGRDETVLTNTVVLSDGVARTFANVDLVIGTPQRFNAQLVLPFASPALGTQEQRHILSFVELLVIDEADDILSGIFTNFACRISSAIDACVNSARRERPVHRLLCSATLTSRIANISELRLQNTKTYALTADGVQDELAAGGDPSGGRVRSSIALPPSLEEHMVIVRHDAQRHAVLLRVLLHVKSTVDADGQGAAILIFVSTSDQARVLSHFITSAGMDALEFTAAATEAERRTAATEAYKGSGCIVVATDALMRGIDLPGVGTVIMYDAPRTLQQYVHRIGRTARAGKPGKSYVLVSREGPSGTQDDGEVAVFRSFDPFLKRARPVLHDRDLRDVDALLDKANLYLDRAQESLQKGWASAATVAALRERRRDEPGIRSRKRPLGAA